MINQCSSCGGFCKKSGCERENVQPKQEPVIDQSAAIRIATALGWEPKRKPLTDEQISEIFAAQRMIYNSNGVTFARAIEAAHGIKGEA